MVVVVNSIDSSQLDLGNFSLAGLTYSDTVLNSEAALYRGIGVVLPALKERSKARK